MRLIKQMFITGSLRFLGLMFLGFRAGGVGREEGKGREVAEKCKMLTFFIC